MFDALARERRPMSSAALAAHVGAPRSSMADLLRTLVDLNLLAIDRRAATYFPTARFAALGSWLQGTWLGTDDLPDALTALAAECGETVTLATPSDLEIEMVYVSGATTGVAWRPEVGQRYSVFGSAVGSCYLGMLPAATVRTMHRRAAAASPQVPPVQRTLAEARAARRAGYGWVQGTYHPDVAALAVHLPNDSRARPTFVGVGGPIRRMVAKRATLEKALKDFVARRAAPGRSARSRAD